MKKLIPKLYWIPVILLMVFTFWVNVNQPAQVFQAAAKEGDLRLQDWDDSSLLKLSGEWKYYEGLMIRDLNSSEDGAIVSLPHLFKNKAEEGGNPYGVATYQLRVEGLRPGVLYGLQIISESSAYRLTINGEDILHAGIVAADRSAYRPETKEKVGYFKPDEAGNAEILIEISNFSYNYGGFWKEAMLGRSDVLSAYVKHQDGFEIFVFTGILVMGLFFLALFSINREFQPTLYFSLINLFIALRVLLTNNKQFYDFVYPISWDLGTRLEFLAGYLLLPLFGLFFYSLGYVRKSKITERIFYSMIAASILIMLFTPNEIYANILPYYLTLCVAFIAYAGFVITQGIRRKKSGSILILLGTLGLIPTVLIDFYFDPVYYLTPVGILYMIVFFSIVVFKNVFQIKRKNDYLEEAILCDPLTGLKNRYYLNKLMDQGYSIPPGNRLYILFMDLDRFKQINDTYGHHVGDFILEESAMRIKSNLFRSTDIVCRYGGDEFIAFIMVQDQEGSIQKIVERILNSFKEPFVDRETNYSVSISIGVSEYKEGDDLEKIIQESDNAMYHAKKTMTSGIMIYNENVTF